MNFLVQSIQRQSMSVAEKMWPMGIREAISILVSFWRVVLSL